ncbi:MAG: hypothetical protein ACHQ4J_04830 [Candidatus Binatia bacterium]
MDVLHSIDVVIAFSTVMLLASTLVTALTQAAVRVFNLRAKNLQAGLASLIAQIDPATLAPYADAIARSVLTHRLIAEPESVLSSVAKWTGITSAAQWTRNKLRRQAKRASARPGTVIQREELIKVLLELASSPMPPEHFNGLQRAELARGALRTAIEKDQNLTAVALLPKIQRRSLELEKECPALATHIRNARAIIETAGGDFVGKINSWFDETMDRLTQQFTQQTRVLTVLGALAVAVLLPLDSLDLLKHLSIDDALRTALLKQAEQVQARADKLQPTPAPAAVLSLEKSIAGSGQAKTAPQSEDAQSPAADNGRAAAQLDAARAREDLAVLRNPGLSIVPETGWFRHEYRTAYWSDSEWGSKLQAAMRLTVDGKSFTLAVDPLTPAGLRDAVNALAIALTARVEPRGFIEATSRIDTPVRVVVSPTTRNGSTTVALTGGDSQTNLLTAACSWRWDLLPGVLLSVVLLSLGAPFWFEVLKKGLQLRPLLAGKEEVERAERKETRQPSRPAARRLRRG